MFSAAEPGSWELFEVTLERRLSLALQTFFPLANHFAGDRISDPLLEEVEAVTDRAKWLRSEEDAQETEPSADLVGAYQVAIDRALLNASALAALYCTEFCTADELPSAEAVG